MSDAIVPNNPPQSSHSARAHTRQSRPSFAERRELLNPAELNTMLRELRTANEETPNEHILRVIKMLSTIRSRSHSAAIDQELIWEQEDLRELLEHIDEFPYSVRTWILHYRDIDNN